MAVATSVASLEDNKGGDVDDTSARAEFTDPIHQRVPQLYEIGIREDGLDGRNQILRLLEDWDSHRISRLDTDMLRPAENHRSRSRLCSRAAVRPLRCRLAGRPLCASCRDRRR